MACLSWCVFSVWGDAAGPAKPLFETGFTLVFIGSGLFLLAGRAVLGAESGRVGQWGVWIAPCLLLLFGRHYVDMSGTLQYAMMVVTLTAAGLLLHLAADPWKTLMDR
jgi:hypothetical protein